MSSKNSNQINVPEARQAMNALKQEKNGGYADRTAAGSREQKLVIELKGVGSGAAL